MHCPHAETELMIPEEEIFLKVFGELVFMKKEEETKHKKRVITN